ncbi:MAG: endonuclease V [Candidatus Thermoplasmatota archaeon]|nr:endonuclease V [Candidatus Thermoplasmatota archaeon]
MDWNLSPGEASKLQERLSQKLVLALKIKEPKFVCGVDVAFDTNKAYAVCCLFSVPELKLIEEATAIMSINYPYLPGLFAFREGPALLQAIKKLKEVRPRTEPDLILFDGHGIAHPRRFGIASHLGYLLNKPTIGCAKTRLVGEYDEPGTKRGSWTPLVFEKAVVGAVVRTKDRVKPVFLSPGNLIDIETAVKIVLLLTRGYRIPEPLRIANIKSRKLKSLR